MTRSEPIRVDADLWSSLVSALVNLLNCVIFGQFVDPDQEVAVFIEAIHHKRKLFVLYCQDRVKRWLAPTRVTNSRCRMQWCPYRIAKQRPFSIRGRDREYFEQASVDNTPRRLLDGDRLGLECDRVAGGSQQTRIGVRISDRKHSLGSNS